MYDNPYSNILKTRGTLSASAGVSRIFLAVCYLRVMPSASPVFPLIENCGGFFFGKKFLTLFMVDSTGPSLRSDGVDY